MVTTEFRVWREVDNRAKDGRFFQSQQDEITALRREVKRLKELLRGSEVDKMLVELAR